ncbi:serine/threonine-protein kinase [Nonomuraea aurantiaca]|uniref:serine/threonine-protein kinase n=1 Tax=Nonomuraea aurantiaca TaxID=2878562 RepID=UPI001CD9FD92|nr:serine/threonine-protein kinase [Nonomuraea aurantiaca]MCA2225473.1 serine/threonine protein kinase [Nonomuraea aurantiaca]
MSGERVIGGYTLRRVLGRGGMGEVHLATTPTGGLAAVKVIHPELARDPAFRRRFEREVAAARRVARFCTAPVLDAGMDGDIAYLVTEYVKGPDLAKAVREQGPLSGSDLEALVVGIATALGAIHGAGVVHRDLKPSNVLLSPLGPRVIDFGIAQLVEADSQASQAILGTPAFMAPEQVRGEPLGPAADVYAWGGVIAFAGTGRLPFGGGSPAEVLYRIVNEGPRLDGLDAAMRDVVERAMARDPRLRPTARQLLESLTGGRRLSPATATQVVERTWTGPRGLTAEQQAAFGARGGERVGAVEDRGLAAAVEDAPVQAAVGVSLARGGRGGVARRRWPWAAGAVAVLAAVVVGVVVVPRVWSPSWPYAAGFGDSWATGASDGGDARVAGSDYVLTAKPGWRLWKSAPVPEPSGGVVVSAKARLEQGSGEYGVWCHGSANSGDRYEFGVSGSGRVTIVKRRTGQKGTSLYGPAALNGAAAARGGRIVAECAGPSDSAGVTLRMWVNEELVAEVSDASDPLGPGAAGVQVAPDAGEALRVRFESFAIDRTKD